MTAAPVIATVPALPAGTVGVAYSFTFTTSAGDPAPTWTVSAGSLPAGLSLSTAGVLSGLPTTAGSSTFTVQAANGVAPADTVEASLTVAANTIASVADLGRHLNETIPAGSTAAAQQALESAQATVQSWVGRSLVRERSTVTLTVGAEAVTLPDTPVAAVHSVTVDGVASTDWQLDADGSLWWPVAPTRGASIVVDYTHGFAVGSRELLAARLLVLRQAERIFTNPRNRSSYTGPGPDGYGFVTDMPARIVTPDERDLLALIARPSGF